METLCMTTPSERLHEACRQVREARAATRDAAKAAIAHALPGARSLRWEVEHEFMDDGTTYAYAIDMLAEGFGGRTVYLPTGFDGDRMREAAHMNAPSADEERIEDATDDDLLGIMAEHLGISADAMLLCVQAIEVILDDDMYARSVLLPIPMQAEDPSQGVL